MARGHSHSRQKHNVRRCTAAPPAQVAPQAARRAGVLICRVAPPPSLGAGGPLYRLGRRVRIRQAATAPLRIAYNGTTAAPRWAGARPISKRDSRVRMRRVWWICGAGERPRSIVIDRSGSYTVDRACALINRAQVLRWGAHARETPDSTPGWPGEILGDSVTEAFRAAYVESPR